MKTIYEILEVSENASKEVIEKAYKVLAKKYHPDLQEEDNKEESKKKMQEINEAYEILSDDVKRKEYDAKLLEQREIEKQKQFGDYSQSQDYEYNQTIQNQQGTSQEEQRYRDMQRRRYEEELLKQQEKLKRQMEKNMQEQYENAYYGYLRSLGYKIKEKWTWKKTKNLIIIITTLILIGIVLWYIPPTKKIMIDFYNSNPVIKVIIDIIINIIKAVIKTIGSIFTGN